MTTDWQDRRGPARQVCPWWRPLAISAAAAAGIAGLFNPLPAAAAPNIPGIPAAVAVPDAGSRPIALGTLVMPGQTATSTTLPTTAGLPSTPVIARHEKMQAAIATLGDRLIELGQDRDLARQQQATAEQKVATAQAALSQAQRDAAAAAAASLRDAAAMPPGTLGSTLQDLDALARMQRGESPGEQAAARQLAIVQASMDAARSEQTAAAQLFAQRSAQYTSLNAVIAKKQAALQKFELKHAVELGRADAAETAQDQALGAQYLAGANQGRGADPRAIAALTVALAQRGKPYEWSEEGPDTFDCSGLTYYSYRSAQAGAFPLARVARDQYWQTRNKVVDRYSLLPGDLLFFSYSNSWTGIHHVAMYAGDGMMVEAPRTGLDVRLTPVRWTRLFQATRIYGSVDGPTQGPDLNAPPPAQNGGASHPSATPTPTKPKPSTSPSPSKTTPSSTPTSSSPSPSTSTTPTTTPPTTGSPATSPSGGGSSSPNGSTSSSSSSSSSAGSSPTGSQTSSATAATTASSKSATASSSASSSASTSSSSSGEPK